MPLAFAALGLGVLMLVAGFKGHSVADVLTGKAKGDQPLNPKGADATSVLANALTEISPNSLNVAPLSPTVPGSLSDVRLNILTSECNRIAALRLPYRWGGGHAGYPPNGPFDCSGAVS